MKKNQLAVENYSRKVYHTTDSIEECMKPEYFNPFKHRLAVDDVITIRNPKRYDVMVNQKEPFVAVEWYNDYEQRIAALEETVAELQNGRMNTAA